MKSIRQANDIIAIIERGDLNADLSREIGDVLKSLQDMAPPKGKIKGNVKLTLNFEVSGNTVEIAASIDSKTPKRARGNSVYFLTRDGELSTEHPSQSDMFEGPRSVKTPA